MRVRPKLRKSMENLSKAYELSDGSKIQNFEDFYKAYTKDQEENGFPLNIKNLVTAEFSSEDHQTLSDFWEISKELDELKKDGLFEPEKLESMSYKTAFSIVSQAWENLNQEQESSSLDEEEQEQRQAQSR